MRLCFVVRSAVAQQSAAGAGSGAGAGARVALSAQPIVRGAVKYVRSNGIKLCRNCFEVRFQSGAGSLLRLLRVWWTGG